MSNPRAGGLDLESIEARLPILASPQLKRLSGAILALDLAYVAAVQDAAPVIRSLVTEVRALRTALRPFAERAEWSIASTPGERLSVATDDDVLPISRLACRRAAAVVGAPERDLNESGEAPQP